MIGALIAKKKVAAAFDALNRRDLARFMAGWPDDGVFIYPGDIPEAGIHQGRAAVERWFERLFEQFPAMRWDVQAVCVRNLCDMIGNNVAVVYWHQRSTNRDGVEFRNEGVSIATIKRGRLVSVQDILFELGDGFRRSWGAV